MNSTRRSLFKFIAAAVGSAATARSVEAQSDNQWTPATVLLLATRGANLSIDIQGWDVRQIILIAKTAAEHGGMVTLRSAPLLTPQQAVVLAGSNITFEL